MNTLCIDIGGTEIKYGLIENALIKFKDSFETPKTLNQFKKCIKTIHEKFKDNIDGIAISVNGRCDSNKGIVLSGSSNEYLNSLNLVKLIKNVTKVDKVTIYNDAKCAGLSEIKNGSLKNVKNGLVLTIGTGIGGAIVIDSKIVDSKFNNVGELSYLPYKNGYAWEYLKINKLFKIYNKKANTNINNGIDFFKDYDYDLLKEEALIKYIDRFIPLLQTIVYLIDPEVIAIGGGISKQRIFIQKFKERVNCHEDLAHLKIKACRHNNDANLLGAYYYFKEN